MPDVSLSIAEIFEQAFGYKSSAFEPKFKQLPYAVYEDEPYNKRSSANGQPLVSRDNLGREYYMPVGLGKVELHHPVIQVTSKKNIVETPLVERQGTVKELISIEDWEISIRGLIIDPNNQYPEDDIKKLVDLFYRNEAVEIENAITDIMLKRAERKGNNMVVINELNFPEVRGVMNVRPYELKLVSDTPFDLTEIKS